MRRACLALAEGIGDGIELGNGNPNAETTYNGRLAAVVAEVFPYTTQYLAEKIRTVIDETVIYAGVTKPEDANAQGIVNRNGFDPELIDKGLGEHDGFMDSHENSLTYALPGPSNEPEWEPFFGKW